MACIYEAEIRRAKEYMQEHMKESRRAHTEGVVKTAELLARRFGADADRSVTAAWFHDLVRNLPPQQLNEYVRSFRLPERYLNDPNLSHGKIAAKLMEEEYGIKDPDLLNAVANHTTGRAGMSLLEKVVFLADVIEPGRSHPTVDETRRLAETDLDAACIHAMDRTLEYVRSLGQVPDPDTIEARNDLAMRQEKKK